MNIAVFIKQVPSTDRVEINPSDGTIRRIGGKSEINPFDLYAIQSAIDVRNQTGGKVVAFTMGPKQAEAVLLEAVALGCDKTYLVSDRLFAGSDTLATSKTLAKAVKFAGQFDLLICGKQAIDGDTAQVGAELSIFLNVNYSAGISSIEKINKNFIVLRREREYGYDVLEIKLPTLITVTKDISTIPPVTLSNRLKALEHTPELLEAKDIKIGKYETGLAGSPTRVYKSFKPKLSSKSFIFNSKKDFIQQLKKDLHRIL